MPVFASDGSRLEAIVACSADAIYATDTEGIVTAWNPAAEALYGWPAAEIIGCSVATLIPDDRSEELVAILARVRGGGVLLDFRTQRLARDGRRMEVSMSASPIRGEDGAIVGVSTIARDIADRLAAEADRAYLETVVGHSHDAVIAVDLDDVVTTWNPAAERLYGHPAPEAIGRRGEDLLGLTDAERDARRELVATVLAGETPRVEILCRSRDGQGLEFEASLSPLRDRAGDVTGVVGIVRDVTAAREAARRAERLTEELHRSRRLESVGELAGGIAHDFNNLLGVILNYAAFAAEAVPERSAARGDLEHIQRAAERGAGLTRQLLHFSRSDAVRREVVDVNALLADLRPLLAQALGARVELGLSLGEGLWPVEADRGQLEQVLVNLAINGRDAMPTGGRLVIETTNVSRPGGGLMARITVRDTGTGMTETIRSRAFEPYFTTKPPGEGTGLGLATVQGIVADAAGTVVLDSALGRGTAVRVELPVCAKAVSAAAPTDVDPAASGCGERVLVCDDEAEVREMIERILGASRYRVSGVGSAAHALAASGRSIDLLVTDVAMPGMLGTELAERMRRGRPDLRVLLTSGDARFGPSGVSPLLAKPFTAEGLRSAVRGALDAQAPPIR